MSPAELAQRIAALDWSAMSLQHQLAVSAAVETLTGVELMTPTPIEEAKERRTLENVGYTFGRMIVPDTAVVSLAPGGVIVTDAPCNVTVLSVRKRTCWTTLCHLDGREWARSSHFGPGGAWNWILESVAHEHSVSEDQIGGMEGDDGCDLVTVDGLPVYRIVHLC